MTSILIKDTTRKERIRIVNQALNCGAGGCENCSSCWLGGGNVDGIYQDYVDGKKELVQINMEYSERFAGKQSGYGVRVEKEERVGERKEKKEEDNRKEGYAP